MWMYFILLFSYAFFKFSYATIANDEQRLVNKIFQNYNKKLRPVANTADVVNVTLNPSLFSIVETSEAEETITLVLWQAMNWNDVFIKWNSSEYGGMEKFHIPISEIWYPDIYVDNSIESQTIIPDEKNYAIIDHNGAVSISIVRILKINCKYHIIMFPFDIQNCSLMIGSWMHTRSQMNISITTPTDMSDYHRNPEWDLISMNARSRNAFYDNLATAFTNVYYDILIERKPTYFLITFVLPCFMISTISTIGIFAPFNDAGDREEKVTMGLTTLLTMTVYITLIAYNMPKSSEGLPLLGTYVMIQVATGAITSLVAVITMYQNRKWTTGDPIPGWILMLTRVKSEECYASAKVAKGAAITQYYKTDDMKSIDNSGSVNGKGQQQKVILKDVECMVRQIIEYLHDQRREQSLRKEWQRASERLDLILMIVFLAFNSNTHDVINVTLNPELFSIVETDEADESITIVLWLEMIWNDTFLQWNMSEYGGVKQLFLPMGYIWIPDVIIYNANNVERPIPEARNYVIIYNNGSIDFATVQVLQLHCEYHIVMFPFDVQTCTMEMGSWVFDIDHIDIFNKVPTDMSAFHPNSEWNFISMEAVKKDGPFTTGWPSIYYDIVIQRKPSYYLLTFVLPCFMITTISIVGIFAPFNDAGEREQKVTMGLTTLLTMTVYLTLIADKMPKSSEGLPLLGTYILLQIAVTVVTSLMSVLIMYQSRKWIFGDPVPDWIITVTRLNHNADKSSAKKAKKINETESDDSDTFATPNKQQRVVKHIQSMFCVIVEDMYEKNEIENLRMQWQLASHRLDLLLMIVFLMLNCFLTGCLLMVGYSNRQI